MKRILLVGVMLAALVTAGSASATTYQTYVSEYGMDAKLSAKYDYASCSGLRRYGSQAMNTTQWGWVRGYIRFACAYNTEYQDCFDGQFEAWVNITGGRRGNWYVHRVSAGSCYAK